MNKKKLFLIQDSDRPMYVVATGFQQALSLWSVKMAKENDCALKEVDFPQGIQFVADSDDIIL